MDRTCARCHDSKGAGDFYPSHRSWCKECFKKYTRDRREPKREKWPFGQRRCALCKELLDLEKFRPKSTGGVHSYCRPCELEYNEIRRKQRVKSARGPLGSQHAEWRITGIQKCPSCGESKPIGGFAWNKTKQRPYGYCRDCTRERNKAFMRTPAGRASQRRYYEKRLQTPEGQRKWAARSMVQAAIRGGWLIRQPCEVCGVIDVQAHHDDYSQPLVVRWLCIPHHNEHHKEENT